MALLKDLAAAMQAYSRVWAFVRQHGLLRACVGVSLLNMLLFVAVLVLGFWAMFGLTDRLAALLPAEPSGSWQAWLYTIAKWVLRLLFLLWLLKLYKYIVLTVGAPAFGYLAERVQEQQTGRQAPFRVRVLLGNIIRGFRMNLTNFLLECCLTIPLTAIGLFMPYLGPFVLLFIALVESYFWGFAFVDYKLEYNGYSAKESRRLINRRIGFTMGIGMGFYLMLFVPVLGVICGPPLAIVAAGIGFDEQT